MSALRQLDRINPVLWECAAWIVTLAVLVVLMTPALILGQTTYAHDNLYWGIPIYHFWTESLLHGRLPLWNPFSHGGEPFYPFLLQSRALDPNSLVVLAIGSRFTDDLVTLFNWDRFVRGLLIALGTHLLLRRWAEHLITRLALVPVVLLSSYHFVAYRANGIPDQFQWVPWILLVLCLILEGRGKHWRDWFLLGGLLGLNWQSYFFAGVWTLLLVFLMGVILFRRDLLLDLWQTPWSWMRATCAGLIVVLMILPNAMLFAERDRYVYPARMVEAEVVDGRPLGGPVQYEPRKGSIKIDSIVMPYAFVELTGSFSTVWNFVQMVVPFANQAIDRQWHRGVWGHASEGFMYFGLLAYVGAVYGFVAGRHPYKRIWTVVGITFGLLMLGPNGFVHRLLFSIYPPLWFMRHTLVFVQFFSLAVLYFFVIGCDRALTTGGPLAVTTKEGWLQPTNWETRQVLSFGVILGLAGLGTTAARSPYQWLTVPLIVLSGCLVWSVRSRLGPPASFWTIMVGHLLLLLLVGRGLERYLPVLLVFGVAPLIVALHRKRRQGAYGSGLPVVLMIFLACDLVNYAIGVSPLWSWERPDQVLGFDAKPQLPRFPGQREPFPPCQRAAGTSVCATHRGEVLYWQQVRYSEVLHRIPVVFTPLYWESKDSPPALIQDRGTALAVGVESKRVNSFLLLRGYYSLLASALDPAVLGEIFAVGGPLIQFKLNSIMLDNAAALSRLRTVIIARADRSDGLPLILATTGDPLNRGSDEVVQPGGGSGSYRSSGGVRSLVKDGFQPDLTIVQYDYNSLALFVQSDDDGFLYWADGYDPDWRAFVDGAEVPLYRANIAFKAVQLPKGVHRVEFVYDPVWFKRAVLVFYATVLICLALFLGLTVRDRFNRPIAAQTRS